MPKLDNPAAAGGATHAGLPDVSANQHHVSFVQADHDGLANPHHSNANDHAAAHTLTSHSTRAHSELTGIVADDHHAETHVLDGVKHTVSGLTIGHVLKATGAAAAAFGQLLHSQLGSVGADDHHAQSHTLTSHSTRAHAELSAIGADDHHAQLHEATHELGGTDPVPMPLAPTTTVTIPSAHCAVVAGRYYVTAAAKLVIADTARFAIV